MKIVVSQPMYLPWAGLFDQIKQADLFVHYDDVMLPQGRSFITRVQIKINNICKWLTVPIKKSTRHLIYDVDIDFTQNWFERHYRTIKFALSKACYFKDVNFLFDEFNSYEFRKISDLNIFFIEHIANYLGFTTKFVRSSSLKLTTHSSERLLDICNFYQAKKYITGHGARNYLDHNIFADYGIQVEYMDYNIKKYEQFGEFTPYVTVLDLIAHTGKDAVNYLQSTTVPWRSFISE